MPMTVVVTRNPSPRMTGFLASCMCEIAPGVFTAPALNRRVRERIWLTLENMFTPASEMSIVMTWHSSAHHAGQEVLMLGTPARELGEFDGLHVAFTPLTEADVCSLKKREKLNI